jgi:hypothetical protein
VVPIPGPIPFGNPADRIKLDEARGEVRTLQEEVADLHRRLDKQAVLLRALFALLGERLGLTEAELLDRFRQVEAERAGMPAKKCSQCGRAVSLRFHRCVYCGAPCEVESAFEFLELGAWPRQEPQPPPTSRPPEGHGITSRPRD